jgi:hypothetical protein
MVLEGWYTKMMVVPTREIGVMDDGMDLEKPPLPTQIRMRENIDSIDVTDAASIVGPMDAFMMVNSVKTNVMAKGPFEWPDGATYTGDFNNGRRKDMVATQFSDGGYYVGSWIDGRYDGFGGTLTSIGCLYCSISLPFLGHSHVVHIHSHTCCIPGSTLFFME